MNTSQKFARATLAALIGCIAPMALAQEVSDYDAVPPLLTGSARPMVMLAMSNDHQLSYKAFTDYDDLDGDGIVETTYTHSFDYVGYFDPYKCYAYSTTDKRFAPVANSADKYCSADAKNQWSGNFLNWATMTRMDQVRKVLYGGKRVVDTAAVTVLERAFLANDAHSFAKYYNGPDLNRLTPFGYLTTNVSDSRDSGITICNTTRHSGTKLSQNVTDPPLARVVKGNYSLWAANERYQCLFSGEKSASNGNDASKTGIYAYASNPAKSAQPNEWGGAAVGDYVVRVESCGFNPGFGREDCKQYPAGNHKPIGILQRFGDNEAVHFGLLTGSYLKNKSGGVLRKNIGSITDEINVDSDGTFKTAPASGAIIAAIDLFRLVNYQYSDGTYNSSDNCTWGKNSFANGSCTNWGNPLAEIMLECYRYFAGKQPTQAFLANDASLLPGMPGLSVWNNPQTEDTACAKLNLITFNASTVSYDGDELGGMSDLNSINSAQVRTNQVGLGEGIHGKYFFVGKAGDSTDQLCTAKQVDSLGSVQGTCPDAPRLEGTYNSAGIAYHANISDIRTDISDQQSVRTYGVTLAPALPQVSLTTASGKRVSILPACHNRSVGGACGLVDFKIVEQYRSGNTQFGRFYVNWEDSEQGGDYDQDIAGTLSYELNDEELIITTGLFVNSTPDRMGFGYVISGTVSDGMHVRSGSNGYSGYGCNNCRMEDQAATAKYKLGASTVGDDTVDSLKQPLYYAAKWGGFVDMDGNRAPSDQREWDQKNNTTGELGADGVPDSFFWAINPDTLRTQLSSILINILDRTASGTSAAVVSNTGAGEGALYQALYNPRYAPTNGVDSVSWVGTLNALFVDSYGNIREDDAAPYQRLTDADSIVDVYYDSVSQKTQIQRYALGANGERGEAVGSPQLVQDIKPIWSAGDLLGQVKDYVTQREHYADDALDGRYLITGLDADGDGLINQGEINETQAFTAATFSGDDNRFRLLGLTDATRARAGNLVNWVRGEAVAGYRNRRLDVDGDGDLDPILLGDIVHSSPVAVTRPQAGYDLAFNDDTYRAFRQKYQRRRQMVYVGANDGMLHAFNAGFFDSSISGYRLSLNGETSHPLGAELWAYIPYNLLPHLKWLASPDYPHVYYMDGVVKVFDANIFTPSATHPGGWGTVLVATMRFGGGAYTLDPDSDLDDDTSDDITLRSALVLLDVTDPERPPTVLGEITHPDLGYTTAEPAIVKRRAPDPNSGSYADPAANDWYLVFGSGPRGATDAGRATALTSGLSDQPAKLFVYDLKGKSLEVHDVGAAASFVGGIESVDWTRDYQDDALYFGTVGGSVLNPAGQLYRAVLSDQAGGLGVSISPALSGVSRPFSATPLAIPDPLGNYWVYAGTGRYLVSEDNFSTQQQHFLGFKESHVNGVLSGGQRSLTDLVDTTRIAVYTDGSVEHDDGSTQLVLPGLAQPAVSFEDVVAAVAANGGWRLDFERARSRSLTSAVVSDQSLVFSEYQPSGLRCQPEGFGFLHAPHLRAGVPGRFAPLGTVPSAPGASPEDPKQVAGDVALGLGAPSAPALHQRGDGQKSAIVQASTGELSTTLIKSGGEQGARQSWRELIIDWNH